MSEAYGKQSEVIDKTISINQYIVENVRDENERFNAMEESNADDTSEVATQASAINEMVDKMTELLKKGD